jgi:hypothetical protein
VLPAGQGDVAEKVIEGVMNGQSRRGGFGQAAEVSQNLGVGIAEIVIELAAGAELEEIETEAPPKSVFRKCRRRRRAYRGGDRARY